MGCGASATANEADTEEAPETPNPSTTTPPFYSTQEAGQESGESEKFQGFQNDVGKVERETQNGETKEGDNHDDEEEEDEEGEGEEGTTRKKKKPRKRRKSVSSECIEDDAVKNYKPPHHPKDEEAMGRLRHATKNNVFMGKLAEDKLEQVHMAMLPKEVKAGVRIINQGDWGDNYYVVDAGSFQCFKKSELGWGKNGG